MAAEGVVRAAVERDLAELRRWAPKVADSALAASALVLADELDDPGNSATSKSMCARALAEAMDRLRELAPPRQEETRLDQLAAKRAARLTGGSKA